MKKFKMYVNEYIRHETELIILAEDEDSLTEIINKVEQKNNQDAEEYISELRKLLSDKGYKVLGSEVDHMVEPFEKAECTDYFEDDSQEEKPYSEEDYDKAKGMGLDLDDWADYKEFYGLKESEEIE